MARLLRRTQKESHGKYGVLFMDIDDFKKINDSFGHSVRDLFLIEFANRLRSLIVNGVNIYRLHGDEFVIIIDYEYNVYLLAQSVIELLKEAFLIDGTEFYVNISIGITRGCISNGYYYGDSRFY